MKFNTLAFLNLETVKYCCTMKRYYYNNEIQDPLTFVSLQTINLLLFIGNQLT